MSDYNKTNVTIGGNVGSDVNTQLGEIETAVNSKIDKSGSTMTGDLDMNSNQILNLLDAATGGEPVTLRQLQTFGKSNTAATDGAFRSYATMVSAQADVSDLTIGDVIFLEERRANNGGASFWKVVDATTVTENEYDIVTGDATKSFQIISDGYVDVMSLGASRNGSADDLFVFDHAVDNYDVVYFPAGEYICGSLQIPSNTTLRGAGMDKTIIKYKSGLASTACMFNMTQLTSDTSLNIQNVVIEDMRLEGRVVEDAFSEFKHLILCQGVTNLTLNRVHFNAFQGDGLVIRSGNAGFEAKNLNTTVKNCVFDGVNNDNRNGISVTDSDGLLIEGCWFKNITRSDQPGAIDIEPNPTYTFVVLDHITIRDNRFDNIGGNVACISMFLPLDMKTFTQTPKNITVENNTMTNVYRGLQFTQTNSIETDDTYPDVNLKLWNNKVTDPTDRGFWIYGLKGVDVMGNLIENSPNTNRIGWSDANRACNNIRVRENTFRHCGTTDGLGIAIYKSNRLDISNNVFDNVGVSGGGFGVPITFANGTSSKIQINFNHILNNEGLTTAFITNSATITSGDNSLIGNITAGLDATAFAPNITEYGEPTFTGSITAYATGGQANATQLTTAMNTISTVVTTGDSVKLPSANGLGREITITNSGANACDVFPATGDNLGAGVNTAISLAAGTKVTYKSYNATSWYSI